MDNNLTISGNFETDENDFDDNVDVFW